MRKRYRGLDFLRGVGIFFVVALHSAFYHYDNLHSIDMDNPPAIVTVIGLLLMFAGLFAMVSGAVHILRSLSRIIEKSQSPRQNFKHMAICGCYILAIAYLYFIFTGPGLVDMKTRSVDNSLLVGLLSGQGLVWPSLDRLLYVDSLVMIGLNVLFLGLVFTALLAIFRQKPHKIPFALLTSALALLILSIIRLPLYAAYLDARSSGRFLPVMLLNWLVNKNNPLLPFLAFGLFGAWVGSLFYFANRAGSNGYKYVCIRVMPLAIILLLIGIGAYINLPDTMLERSIDLKWYSIMVAQCGLFLLMLLAAIGIFDFNFRKAGLGCSNHRREGITARFFLRFGIAGLTVFFWESVVSFIIFRFIALIFPAFSLALLPSILYGLILAVLWGFVLLFWERSGYRYGIEYTYVWFMERFDTGSTKLDKLESD